jgi:DNA polymerase-2
MRARGFILQASYRIQADVPVVHLYGRLDDGATFLVRDHRQRPHFFIAATDVAKAKAVADVEAIATGRHTFAGVEAFRVDAATPPDVPSIRDRLHAAGVSTYEADVRFATRFLIDRAIKGGCEIDGDAKPGRGANAATAIDWIFDDPNVAPADVDVRPSVLSFDIETDPAATRLLAISLYGCGADEVLIVDPRSRAMPEKATGFADERGALDAFCKRVAELDPDVLTGWNVVDFDLSVLGKIAQRVRHPFELGRDGGSVRVRPARGYFGSGNASIPGRLVLDGMDLLRGAFVRLDDYSLDAVAREILGEGKALSGDARDRVGEIMERYADDLPGFALYARTDARLAFDIVEKSNLIQLAVARSKLTGMTPDRVAASIASFDFLYLAELNKRGIVAPSVMSEDARVFAAQAGGHVLDPKPGVHDRVWVFDFKSLYPSIIRTFNIDPFGYVESPHDGDDVIRTANGIAFRRDPAILPGLLDDLFPRREAAKRAGDSVASHAIKILMNSFYGVLGTPACRFYNPALANAITGQGKHFLLWSKDWFERRGYEVLYGDTDSLFVRSNATEAAAAAHAGGELAARLNDDIAKYIAERWRVASRLELEFEKLYVKLFLPSVRHGSGGARKRYAGLIHGADSNDVEFVGMEVVRRDWTELAKIVQRELYQRLFNGAPVDAYLADFVERVRAGEFDHALVYRKGLRKDIGEYTASTPPHVAAARKSSNSPGRLVTYVMTTAGPEPLDNLVHPPDRAHYVEKQIRPVAESVLGALGLDFDKVIGDDRQIGLF